MLFLHALCAAATFFHAQVPAPTPPPAPVVATSPADSAWAAAHELKKKADYEKAGVAFAAYARDFPGTPRGIEAIVEEGVCWFSIGRARQKLQQNNQDSFQAFGRAALRFETIVKEHGTSAVAGRAQYMRGTVAMFSGDFQGAEREYGNAIERYASDPKYLPKSIERRAAVRRHMLKTVDARADLARYVREFPKGEDFESTKRYLAMLEQFDKPAPELVAEAWAQGDAQKLSSLRGDVVVLYFFATWCENCEKARPFLLDLQKRFEPMGVRMIGIVDHSKGQTLESVRAFLGQNGIQFPVLQDNGGMSTAYRGQKIPDIVLIDRLGRVRWHDNPANLQDATIELLLTEDPSAATGAR